MAYKIADISNYQAPTNGDYRGWYKALKNKYGVSSVCILLSQGTTWHQPYASYQAYHAYKEFGNFSAYHFFEGSGKAEAQNFISALKSVGADKSTVVMIDAETKVNNLTGHINAFIGTITMLVIPTFLCTQWNQCSIMPAMVFKLKTYITNLKFGWLILAMLHV